MAWVGGNSWSQQIGSERHQGADPNSSRRAPQSLVRTGIDQESYYGGRPREGKKGSLTQRRESLAMRWARPQWRPGSAPCAKSGSPAGIRLGVWLDAECTNKKQAAGERPRAWCTTKMLNHGRTIASSHRCREDQRRSILFVPVSSELNSHRRWM